MLVRIVSNKTGEQLFDGRIETLPTLTKGQVIGVYDSNMVNWHYTVAEVIADFNCPSMPRDEVFVSIFVD